MNGLVAFLLIFIGMAEVGLHLDYIRMKYSQKTSTKNNQEKPGSNQSNGGELGNCGVSPIPDTNTKSDVEDS